MFVSIRVARVKNDLIDALMHIFFRLNLRSIVIRNLYISKDLRHATVEIGSLDEYFSDEDALHAIEKRMHLIRKQIKNFISLKYMPIIRFTLDSHQERIESVEAIFKKLSAAEPEIEAISDANNATEEN